MAAAQPEAQALFENGAILDIALQTLERGDLSGTFSGNNVRQVFSGDNIWAKLMKGKKENTVTYFTDGRGRVFLSETPVDFSKTHPLMVRNTNKGSLAQSFIPQEAGTLTYDPKTKKWTFKPEYSLGSTPEEHAAIAKNIREHLPPGTALNEAPDSFLSMTKQQIHTCAEATQKNTSLPNFLGTVVGVDLLAQGSNMALMGQFNTEEGRASATARLSWIVMMDIQAKLMGAGMFSYLRKLEISEASKILGVVAPKIPIACVNKELGTQWTKLVLGYLLNEGDNQQRSKGNKKIAEATAQANFEAGIVLRMLPGNTLDWFLLNKLPDLTMKLCQINPNLRWYINNQSIRIFERVVMGQVSATYVNRAIRPVLEEVRAEKLHPPAPKTTPAPKADPVRAPSEWQLKNWSRYLCLDFS